MVESPRLLVLKGIGGPSLERLCRSLSGLAHLVLINVNTAGLISGFLDESTEAEAVEALGDDGTLIEIDQLDEIVSTVEEFCGNHQVRGIFCQSESLLGFGAAIAEALDLAHPSVAAVANVHDKFRQREVLERAGIPVPRFCRVGSDSDIARALETVPLPAVFKPASGAGGALTYPIDRPAELHRAWVEVHELESTRTTLASYEFILEERLIGECWHDDERWGDYGSVEGLIYGSEFLLVGVTDRTPLAEPFRETGLIIPSSLPQDRQNELVSVASDAVAALGIENAMTHTEIKFTADGPRIIEVNLRIGGHMSHIFHLGCDRDIVMDIGKMTLGDRPETPYELPRFAAWLLPTPPLGADFNHVSGLDELRTHTNVVSVIETHAQHFDWHFAEFDDPAIVLAAADEVGTLLQLSDDITDSVRFERL